MRYPVQPPLLGGALDKSPPLVVVVDDDEAVCRSLKMLLETQGYRVRTYSSGADLLAGPGLGDGDVMLVDYVMPGRDGIEVVGDLRARGWQGIAMLITGRYGAVRPEAAAAARLDAVLEKPLDKESLLASLRALTGGPRR